MKVTLLWVAALLGLTSGCAEWRKGMGGTAENDQNVLTGGPIMGTRIKDLPPAVRKTLAEKAPEAEIADIDLQTQDGRLIYRINFSNPGKNPSVYILDDGILMENTKDNHYRAGGFLKSFQTSRIAK